MAPSNGSTRPERARCVGLLPAAEGLAPRERGQHVQLGCGRQRGSAVAYRDGIKKEAAGSEHSAQGFTMPGSDRIQRVADGGTVTDVDVLALHTSSGSCCRKVPHGYHG